jgi:methyl-accepting chemotaxis protein
MRAPRISNPADRGVRHPATSTHSRRSIEVTAACGVETADSRFIAAAQDGAGRIGALLNEALHQGQITLDDLFNER